MRVGLQSPGAFVPMQRDVAADHMPLPDQRQMGGPAVGDLRLATLAGAEERTSIPSRPLGIRDRTARKWLARYRAREQDFASAPRPAPSPGAGPGLG